ncbi:MAG: hypothetical protein RBR34_00080 [Rhodospirillaceae bacterium]|nr:hypothetical protein [Rhodospirillaceae bacterium]
MRLLFLTGLTLAFCSAASLSVAGETSNRVPPLSESASTPFFAPTHLSLGGMAQRLAVHDRNGVSLGVGPVSESPLAAAGSDSVQGLRLGGYLSWSGGDLHLDTGLRPLTMGGLGVSMTAWTGAPPGEAGTRYGVRIDTGLGGGRFSLTPANRLGLEVSAPDRSDVDLTVAVNHAFTPNLSVAGKAGARQSSDGSPDGERRNEVLFGVGLGIRF